jgi:hypothetical protein
MGQGTQGLPAYLAFTISMSLSYSLSYESESK